MPLAKLDFKIDHDIMQEAHGDRIGRLRLHGSKAHQVVPKFTLLFVKFCHFALLQQGRSQT